MASAAGIEESTITDGTGAVFYFQDPPKYDIPLEAANASFWSSDLNSGFGFTIDSRGDINGDGLTDLAVAGSGTRDGLDFESVYIFYAPFSGDYYADEADAVLSNEHGCCYFGTDVSVADLNADGFADVAVGTPWLSAFSCLSGAVFIFFGPLYGAISSLNADATIYGTHWAEEAGWSLSAGGDVNNDGFGDLLIGAPGTDTRCSSDESGSNSFGRSYLFHGPIFGEQTVDSASATLIGENYGDRSGYSVSLTGDVDADGYSDLMTGALRNDDVDNDAGAAYLFYGPIEGSISLGKADARLLGEAYNHLAGASVLGADTNNDGYSDMIVSATGCGLSCDDSGTVYIVWGGPRRFGKGPQ